MACSPDQDQFLWPLETINITRPSHNGQQASEEHASRADWALPDYEDPEEEEEETKAVTKLPPKPIETVNVVSKLRYFLSERQAQDFIDSCW